MNQSFPPINKNQILTVYTDGAIREESNSSGLAAVVYDDHNQVRFLWSRRAGKLTCNEAEYQAAIMALEELLKRKARRVAVYSDSRVMVDQMSGLAAVRAAGLRPAHARLRELASYFEMVTFTYIPRLRNRLADALANNAAEDLGG